jgi:hypothetical protein
MSHSLESFIFSIQCHSFSKSQMSHYVHVQKVAKVKLGYREEAVGSPIRSSLMSVLHELNISDEFSFFLSFAEKERKKLTPHDMAHNIPCNHPHSCSLKLEPVAEP